MPLGVGRSVFRAYMRARREEGAKTNTNAEIAEAAEGVLRVSPPAAKAAGATDRAMGKK
jgi:hypothetical protein